MPSFRIQAPGNRDFVFSLTKPEVTIGRDTQNDLILEDPRVSRRHAVVCQGPQGVTVHDLQSGNGTFVNAQRITEAVLADHDTIRMGDCTLTFVAQGEEPEKVLREVLQKTPEELITSSSIADYGTSQEIPQVVIRHELEKKQRILALFYELSRKLSSVFSLDEIYDKVFEILLQVTPAGRGFIFRKNEQGEFQEAASRTRDPVAPREPLPISKTIFEKVARERVSVLLEDAKRGSFSLPSHSILFNKIHSVMAAPIIGRRGLLGIIYADRHDVLETFSSDDLDLLNAVAVQTGIAIDTVTTYDRLQREAQARSNYERFLPQQIVDDILRSPEKVKRSRSSTTSCARPRRSSSGACARS